MTTQEARELLARADELPRGEGRTILVERALALAEAAGDERLAFAIRGDLRTEYEQTGERTKAFAMFARCLSDHDKNPELGDERGLLWGFKSTVGALAEFPEIPLDHTLAVLDDMERRYRLAGQGLQPVYMCRTVVTQHVAGAAAADEWYARWHAAPRTILSDCEGCDPSKKVSYLAARGRDEDAIALAEPLLQGRLGCEEQPQGILTRLVPVFLRSGRLDAAVDAHRRAYRLQRTRVSELWAIAVHLEFCARTGNEARGLELLERHLGWLDRAPTPHDGMCFAAAAALLLRRVGEIGHRDLSVRRPAHGDRPAAEVPAETLRADLTRYARDLAARFDARNGTSEQGGLVRELLEAEPVVDRLPLTPHARRAAAPRPAPAPAAADIGDIHDVDRLLDLAEEHWSRREPAAAMAVWRRVDETAGALSTLQQGRRADGEGLDRLLAGDPEGAVGAWRRAAGLYAQAGDEERAQAATGRYAELLCRSGHGDEGLPLLESAFAWLDAGATKRRRALAARCRLAMACAGAGRAEEAVALLDGAEPGDDPGDAADLEMTRARVLSETGGAGVESALRRAADGYRRSAQPAALAEAALLLGQRLAASGDEEAVAEAGHVLDEAVAGAPADGTGLRPAAYAVRGGWLLWRGRAEEAVEDLVEAVAAFTAGGARPQAAYARQDLCAAYLATGRHLEAAEVAEEALPAFEALGDAEALRRTRYLLATAQQELGELDTAAETLTALAEEERAERPRAAAELLDRAADLLSRLDRDATAAERFATAAGLHAAGGDPYGEARSLRRQAMCVLWSGDAEGGRRLMATVRTRLAGLPGEDGDGVPLAWETALVDFDEARILGTLGRYDEAVALAERAASAFTSLDQEEPAAAARSLRADLLAAGAENGGAAT